MPDAGFEVCIIGAGVVGLTTALKLQEILGKNIKCTIIAEKFKEETTSQVAAGIFQPSPTFLVSTAEMSKKCIDNSFHYYRNILNKERNGVREISGYLFSKSKPIRNHLLEGLVPVYRQATEDELNICPGGSKFGTYLETLVIDCKHHLPWAMTKFEENGGKLLKAKIHTLSDLEKIGKFNLLMNCSGLGSMELFGDSKMVPIRGQVFKVYAPWLDKFYYHEKDTYIIPGTEGIVTLGGTRNFDSWNTDICKHDAARIWENCTNLIPKLVDNCKIVNQCVGLRPFRETGVRIEAQIVNEMKIVHNYGHGAYGVTSAPGTADQAVQLALQLIKSNSCKL